VKPVVNLHSARQSILDDAREERIEMVVVGGGPAGVEIAANLWRLARDGRKQARICLIAGRPILGDLPPRARDFALESLSAKGILVREGVRASSLDQNVMILSDGSVLPCHYAFMAGGVRPSALFRDSGLPVAQDGSLSVDSSLRCVGRAELFGGGDCVSVAGFSLAKVGVHAVWQGRVLRHNLLAALEGGILRPYSPKRHYMLILNTGDGRGILCKSNHVWEGRWPFMLKDFVDQRFMRAFQVSGEREEA
jgi:NADH dehydrogenase FAD-containing subunit